MTTAMRLTLKASRPKSVVEATGKKQKAAAKRRGILMENDACKTFAQNGIVSLP